jgi:hypothetical protein
VNNNFSTLKNLALMREGKRNRISSYDKTGGNNDFLIIGPKQSQSIALIKGAGCINHIWMTLGEIKDTGTKNYLRKVTLSMKWDGEKYPSVEVPIGDFFGMGHAQTKNFNSMPLSMGPEDGKSFNCFFAMPFSEKAEIEVLNEYEGAIRLYFYIDYESYDKLSDNYLRFHSTWRRKNPCTGIKEGDMSNEAFQFGGKNSSGKDNYLILEAKGRGHYVGCHLDIHNLRITDKWNWYGEGDDMIFIDDDKWPPMLHGTGTEDYFNMAWCPTQEFNDPYYGTSLPGGKNWAGKITLYRYHIEDPVIFNDSIKVTIEHGHNNHRSDDYSSTAYWYQNEPHMRFEPMPPSDMRLPLDEIKPFDEKEVRKYIKH